MAGVLTHGADDSLLMSNGKFPTQNLTDTFKNNGHFRFFSHPYQHLLGHVTRNPFPVKLIQFLQVPCKAEY